MKNLYIFAIGGSGERVMRSFIMLLAAGVKLGATNVIPIFVDNDAKSAALTRCRDLIKYYNATAKEYGKMGIGTVCQQYDANSRASFFQTKIEEPIFLNIAGDEIGNLKSIIGTGLSADDPVQKEILEERDLLFSEDDLEMTLTVGFVGNPNIGSVVLNSLSFTDPKFEDVLTGAGANDGVMVVGSLFGGTGAAGFPLIVNNFMQTGTNNRPTIGGVAMLPYFEFGTEDGYQGDEIIIDTSKYDVNSDSFSTKTRAALMYYDDYMKGMDFLYYVGDDRRSVYPHFVGGPKQDNPVHLVELLGAISIVDFSRQNNQDSIVYKQPICGIDEDQASNPTICNMSSVKSSEIKRALIKFALLREFFINDKEGFLWHAINNSSPYAKDIDFKEEMRKACVGDDPRKVYKDTNEMSNMVERETDKFPYAWGLNAFFKEWVSWCDDLYGRTAKRTFNIFPNQDQDIDQANITYKFYSASKHGVARTQTVMRGFPGWRHEVIEPIAPKLANNINTAHNKLRFSKLPEDKKLAALLKTISDGLDLVIESSCAL